MKRTLTLLMVPLVVLLALGLMVAGCGSSTTTTSVTTASTTTSAGATGTTVAGGTGGIPTSLAVPLTGAQEVPPTNTGATGTFTLTLNMPSGGASSASTAGTSAGGGLIPAGLTVSFKLEVSNMTNITAAHIHLGAVGQNGPVIYPLFSGPEKNGSFTGVLAEGPLVESNLTGPYQGKTFSDLVTAVLTGQCYVNVHTTANPNGEIRGQIIINVGGATPTTAAGGAAGATTTTAAAGGTATTAGGY